MRSEIMTDYVYLTIVSPKGKRTKELFNHIKELQSMMECLPKE